MIKFPDTFGIPESNYLPVRFSVLSAIIWWGIFAIPLFLWVKERSISQPSEADIGVSPLDYVKTGFSRVLDTLKKIRRFKELFKFLIAFLLYNDGIQTTIAMAGIFGSKVLNMKQEELVQCYLLVQGIAFVGAIIFGHLADRLNNKIVIYITLFGWCIIVIWALFMRSTIEYWLLGIIMGLVMGGSQSASRSLLGLFTPRESSAEFFGFFAVSGRFASVAGPLVFGIIDHIFRNMRLGIFFVIIFFLAGMCILYFVDEKKGIKEAETL
jgi:UMF1 family MFS transporter